VIFSPRASIPIPGLVAPGGMLAQPLESERQRAESRNSTEENQMKITNDGVNAMWKTHVAARYAKLERARPYAQTRDSQRFLVWLWMACERLAPDEPDKLFEWSLEKFADEAGVNVLRPKSPNELQPPAMWKDLWGRDLPNPFDKASPDLQAQTLLAQRAPELAKWLKAFAESPYSALCAWQDEQAAILKKKKLSYDADMHQANVFANANASETDKAAFIKNAPAEVAERCRWEAREIEFPGAGKNFNLTAQSRISTIPRLSAIWDSMISQEREYVMAEKASLRQQREQAEARLKALEAASGTPQPERLVQRARVGAE
jgi:hypothetical protein